MSTFMSDNDENVNNVRHFEGSYSRWFCVLYLTRMHSLSRRMIRFDAQAFEQILPIFFEMPKVWHLFCFEILSMQSFVKHLINFVVSDCFCRTATLDFYNYDHSLVFFSSMDMIVLIRHHFCRFRLIFYILL